MLGVAGGALTPNELIRALLRAPVDLLWNGGIGTYVKAKEETHAEVGDRANDAVRVDAEELRCRSSARAATSASRSAPASSTRSRGGRVNTDAIDNSAGVDCSDHEVNIKILLDAIVAAGDLTPKQRNALLAEMTEEVAALVLRDNYDQAQAIATSAAQAASMAEVHERYIRSLEQAGAAQPRARGAARRRRAGGAAKPRAGPGDAGASDPALVHEARPSTRSYLPPGCRTTRPSRLSS